MPMERPSAPSALLLLLLQLPMHHCWTAAHGPRARRSVAAVTMHEARSEQTTEAVDVSAAAAVASDLMDEAEKDAAIDGIYAGAATHAYLDTRVDVLGEIDSSELLYHDEAAGLFPPFLEEVDPESNATSTRCQMVWVDEPSCIGCGFCPAVARNTFVMDPAYGKARAYQQGGDVRECVDEAIDSCPANCIHYCTRDELEVLEEHRGLHLEDSLAIGNRMGGFASWRDPLNSESWRKVENSRREQSRTSGKQ